MTLAEYSAIRREYFQAIQNNVEDYLQGGGESNKKEIIALVALLYARVAFLAFQDGGGGDKLNKQAETYLAGRIKTEQAYVSEMFSKLKQAREDGVDDIDAAFEGQRRAELYSRTLDQLYANAKLIGAGGTMLTFDGEDGQESCIDCTRLKGKRRSARWWVKTNNVPPSRDFECHGYNCQHYLRDDNGRIYTI